MEQKTFDEFLQHLEDQSTTEASTVADMLDGIAGNDDAEMQTPAHLIGCLDELKGWADYAIKWLKKFPKENPVPRSGEE